jgi:hypothetical protein
MTCAAAMAPMKPLLPAAPERHTGAGPLSSPGAPVAADLEVVFVTAVSSDMVPML